MRKIKVLRWAEHVARLDANNVAEKVFESKPDVRRARIHLNLCYKYSVDDFNNLDNAEHGEQQL